MSTDGGDCKPISCVSAAKNCGTLSDACGGTLDCGTCAAPETCGGEGVPNECGTGTCTPTTCAAEGASCGSISDGCSESLDCGTCTEPETCGGAGVAHVCGKSTCTPPLCVSNIQSGAWFEVPNSHLPAYDGPLAGAIHGDTGPTAIMSAWNGAALDTTLNRLIVFGGGHRDYWGNEVYAFSLNSLAWTELSLPSDPGSSCSSAQNGCSGPTFADGQPTPVHTYGSPTYIPSINAVFSLAGATNVGYTGHYWLFGFAENEWTDDLVPPTAAGGGSSNVSALDPTTGNVFGMPYGPIGGQTTHGLFEYAPANDSWTVHGEEFAPDYHMSAAIDPVHRYFVVVGGGYMHAYSLTDGSLVQSNSSGDQAIPNGNAPGIAWDSATGKFVGWNGGATVYVLDPSTWVWTTVDPSPTNSVTPTDPNETGTFGRFQYDAAQNVFVLVNSVNENVFLYKPDF